MTLSTTSLGSMVLRILRSCMMFSISTRSAFPCMWGLRFGVRGLVFGVQVSGFGVQGLRFGVQGLGFEVPSVGLRTVALGL